MGRPKQSRAEGQHVDRGNRLRLLRPRHDAEKRSASQMCSGGLVHQALSKTVQEFASSLQCYRSRFCVFSDLLPVLLRRRRILGRKGSASKLVDVEEDGVVEAQVAHSLLPPFKHALDPGLCVNITQY